MSKSITLCLWLILIYTMSLGQCPQYNSEIPVLKTVTIQATVTLNPRNNFYTYEYKMMNGNASTGCIRRFQIDIASPKNALKLPDSGLVDYPRYIDRNALLSEMAVSIVPVGIPVLPNVNGFKSAWSAGFSVRGFVDWASSNRAFDVPPGKEIKGLQMTSYGLPSLRAFIISPSYNPSPRVVVTPENEDSVRNYLPERSERENKALLRIRDSIQWKGVTVAPAAPPLNSSLLVWVDTLLSYTRQSVALGWLGAGRDDDCDNDEHPQNGIEKNIVRRLSMARKDLERGDSVKARRDLESLVKKVDRIWKRVGDGGKREGRGRGDDGERGKGIGRGREKNVIMTSEAYALLKYNSEYLIDRLPMRERHEGKKEK